MKTGNAILLGCGAMMILAVLLLVAGGVYVYHVFQDPEGLAVTVSGPPDVEVGQTFDLEVQVTNERTGRAVQISSVDIGEEYLKGFTISSIAPKPKSNTHIPLDDSRSFEFDVSIAAGATETLVFTLRAEVAGIYRGDVDVCEGMQFVTEMAQTVVRDAE